ncbi:SAV_915 family protein [Spongisporangium articulatum]|uniref:SAV_915 family protein n=1 Tax=Spongisporangium articulatum TaxID=3362603 RepID=A0ABW8ATY3_9ACTN
MLHTEGLPRDFPPYLYLPCHEDVPDPAEARLLLRQTRDGRTALFAYSALDRLRTCCGEGQPWIVVPVTMLEALQRLDPFQLLLMDVVIPQEYRRPAEVRA